jgi:porin
MIRSGTRYLAILLASLCPLLHALPVAAEGGVGFGGPDSVPRQLERDTQDWLGTKQALAEKGLQFTLDYSAVGLRASESLPDTDDNAAGGMVRFYGQWEATGRGRRNHAGREFLFDRRPHRYERGPY